MFRRRLRIPSGSGLLRARPAPTILSPFARPAAVASRHQHGLAGLHGVPPLTYDDNFKEEGIYGLYTPHGFETAWESYQTWCLAMLNQNIAGTELQEGNKSAFEIAVMTSREASQAATFNYASMAHNNHFFFNSIIPSLTRNEQGEFVENPPYEHMPPELQKDLETSFGSLENLRREMIEQADAMFGPGFVWLVKHHNPGRTKHASPYRVLATYQAGTPYPQAHWRQQGMDMNLQAGLSDPVGDNLNDYFNRANASNHRALLHGNSADAGLESEKKKNPGGALVVPVLCVNTWQHAWMMTWGVHGKRGYLEAWWKSIHWGMVADRASKDGKAMTTNPDVGENSSVALNRPRGQLPPASASQMEEPPVQPAL